MVVLPRLDSLEARWFGAAWFPIDLPRHLTHFTAATLRRHIEAAGLEVDEIRSIRRPAVVRRSLARLAEDRRSRILALLARSRLFSGLIGAAAWLAGRSGEMMCIARKPL